MKRSWFVAILLVLAALYLVGCASPQDKAQKMFNAAQYEELVAKYGSDPQLAGLVSQAKEKLAEKLLAEGKFQSILEMYPETAVAKEAKNKIAEGLLAEKKFQEILDKYADTPAAQFARLELEQAKGNVPGAPGNVDTNKGGSDKNAKAQAEFDRIMKVRVPALRTKALKEFIANPVYAGTPAVAKAKSVLN
jgi:hypothetical protein